MAQDRLNALFHAPISPQWATAPSASLPSQSTTLETSIYPLSTSNPQADNQLLYADQYAARRITSTGKGILIGMLSAFGSALLIAIILVLVYILRYTNRGRIFLDRIGRPGEYDDEQAFLKEESEALEQMDDLQRSEYQRAKAFISANPPESTPTDISLSQFLAIQEKGVSAWEFEPELEIANCFVEGRTEIEFFDSECSVQTNLPVPKQNDVYYWEAKIYDKPEATNISIGMTTKPYPLFRLPGLHKTSVAYTSQGPRRFNQPFPHSSSPYGPPYVVGDVIGVGYRPRTGTVFFTRNGRKLDDVTHTLKNPNLFPTVGATGPCVVHVNFGQSGFVYIEANVKKWGLAPMTGSLAPPPPYGSEQGSILLDAGQRGVREGEGYLYNSWSQTTPAHGRTRSGQVRVARQQPRSPGPIRSPTDISLAQLSIIDDDGDEIEPGESASQYTPQTPIRHPSQSVNLQTPQTPQYYHTAQSQRHLSTPQYQQTPQQTPQHQYQTPQQQQQAQDSNLVDIVGALQASEHGTPLSHMNLPPGLLDAHFAAAAADAAGPPPPEYESPPPGSSEGEDDGRALGEEDATPRPNIFMRAAQMAKGRRRSSRRGDEEEERGLLGQASGQGQEREGGERSPPIPSYDVAVGSVRGRT